MSKNILFQRDEFIKEIYFSAKKNRKIFFLSADFGAPALDNFRFKLKSQYLHLGICEQNMVDFAAGLALEDNKVFIYAMAPFLSLRCLEQHKTTTCLMDLDVCSIITGIGLSYANSGPTHYSTEDFACLRSLPNCEIYTASDPEAAKLIAKFTLLNKKPKFVRLDRKAENNFLNKLNLQNVKEGYRFLKKSHPDKKKVCIIGQGTIIRRAIDAVSTLEEKDKFSVSVIDLIRAKPFPKKLQKIIDQYDSILTIDEQTSPGGLGSLIYENLFKKKLTINLSLPDKFIFDNVGRAKLLDINGLSIQDIKKNILRLAK
tara:strand:+ start:510 stop:1454 length:945 start_codon:yes stop_codon:yes gene_type:complete